ncbi:hypothetical protein BZA05DRAFT_430961 [Tricharina praecox]|uniref:uncharacterized protein n=1 Tax=Tricharina praecox TaxID=43433 RepID=UPI00221F7F41|nr:uncharacterized protein BZA05DRAFT_430961 [Tricharina praecox]KAI5848012.1 hypothetical protein BZA05DRAFT_430961 [Tricharina praecox]
MEPADPPTFRAQYARRLVREKLFEELSRRHAAYGTEPGCAPPPGPPLLGGGPQTQPPHHPSEFCIVGAGMAGLYAAMVLDEAGVSYDLLESAGRVGGRVFTKRLGDGKNEYYDVGAMRFPKIKVMQKTFELFAELEIPLVDYYLAGENCPVMYNDIVGPPENPHETDPYRISQENGGVIPDEAVKDGAEMILSEAFGPLKEALREDFEQGFQMLMELDSFSTREFLRSRLYGDSGLDFHTVQWLETVSTSSGLFDQSFSETVIDSLDFDESPDEAWKCVEGGTSVVTEAMLAKIKTKPELNTRVTGIALGRGAKESDTKMLVTLTNASGAEETREYDTVFNTTTLACAQRIDLTGAELHPAQKDALRALHYDASAKVAIKFKTPWWITQCGITEGGVASTDLPLRTCVYPSFSIHDPVDAPSVLLASYTWAQDAQRISALITPDSPSGEEALKDLLLRDLARLHARHDITLDFLRDQYVTHHAYSWYADPNTAGAFALFGPGQFSNFYPFLARPAADGKLHFVGEASSAHHAWIVGALDSAQRAVMYALLRFGLREEAEEIETRWGPVGEVELAKDGTAHLQVAMGCLRTEEIMRCA